MKERSISTATKVIQKLSAAIIATAILCVLWVAYLIVIPVEVLDVEVPIPATPTRVRAGDTVNLNFKYCKYKNYDSQIKVDFIGNYIIPSLSTTRSFKTGCHSENLAINIPAGAPDGVYNVRLQIDYQVNILRREHYVFDSVDIRVINNTDQKVIEIGDRTAE